VEVSADVDPLLVVLPCRCCVSEVCTVVDVVAKLMSIAVSLSIAFSRSYRRSISADVNGASPPATTQ